MLFVITLPNSHKIFWYYFPIHHINIFLIIYEKFKNNELMAIELLCIIFNEINLYKQHCDIYRIGTA